MPGCVGKLCAWGLASALLVGQAQAQTIVQDRDEPGRNKYQAHASIASVCTFQSGCVATFPLVPAGERVVVEYASCDLAVPSDVTGALVSLTGQVDGPQHRVYLPATLQGVFDGSVAVFVVSAPLKFYFSAGDTPLISVAFNAAIGASPGDCELTGYRVLLP